MRQQVIQGLLFLVAITMATNGQYANVYGQVCQSDHRHLLVVRDAHLDWGGTVATLGQEDIENPASPICICPGTPIRIGLAIGFWEPARQVDVTRKPFCLVSLGGISLNPGIPAPEAAQWTRTTGPASSAFYQAHWYVNPMLYWLEVLLDFACLEHGPASSAFYQAHWYVNPMLYWLEVLLDFACLEQAASTSPISLKWIRCGRTTNSR